MCDSFLGPRVSVRDSPIGGGLGYAAIEVRAHPGSRNVAPIHLQGFEPTRSQEPVDRPVPVAATRHPSPERREPILPPDNCRIRRASMLDEDQPALGP